MKKRAGTPAVEKPPGNLTKNTIMVMNYTCEKVRSLLKILGEIQDKVGRASGLHQNDQDSMGFEKAQNLLDEIFELCVKVRSEYAPIQEKTEKTGTR